MSLMPPEQTTSINLKDTLSHLSYNQAVSLLKPHGKQYLQEGGLCDINIIEDVDLNQDHLRVWVDGARIEVYLKKTKSRAALVWRCSCGRKTCLHAGAAFAFVLEEKTPLGLAAEPEIGQVHFALSDAELREKALNERKERAEKEKMRVKSLNSNVLWSDYLVTNTKSGKTYRVALRGFSAGESFCTCPDFRKNTLGTCKHILHAVAKVKKRFSASTCKRPYKQKQVALHLLYGRDLELRFLLPDTVTPALEHVVALVNGQPMTTGQEVLTHLQAFERVGEPVIIYPDAEAYLERLLFRERIQSQVDAVRRNPEQHPMRHRLLNVPLLPYQLDGIAFCVGAGRAILADEMGLGKTIQGIGVAEWLANEAGIERVLVIAPASVKSQWQNEIRKFSNRESQVVLGNAKARADCYQNPVFFTLCNYEQILRDFRLISQEPWDLIILDEGQRIKNWTAKTSKAVKSLCSRFALVLSGTPLENRLDDLYSIMEFIDDRRLGPDFDFYHRHRILDEKGKIVGYQNLEQLREKLSPVLLRRTRASVDQQLPERSTKVIRIAPTDAQLDMHSGFRAAVSRIVSKRYLTEIDLLRLQKALLMCRMTANSTFLVDKLAPGHSSKLAELEQLLDDLSQENDRKIILFSEWTTMLDLIEPLIEKHSWAYVRLDGGVAQKKREQLVHRFQTDPECRLFLTTNAGATGLNLQSANTIINVDLPWNPALLEQRIARAHRMGQKRAVQVYILVTEQTLEEDLLRTLSAKHELALAALDPEATINEVEFRSGIEDLKKRLEVLLGEKQALEEDEVQKQQVMASAERQQRISDSGGEMLLAAFSFMNDLLPNSSDVTQTAQLSESLKRQLNSAMRKTEDGKLQLTLNMPNESAVNTLAETMAKLLQAGSAT